MHRGALAGVGNTFATLASTVGPILIAGMLERYKSWTMNFGFIAFCFFVGAATYTTLADTANLDKPDDPRRGKAKANDGEISPDRIERV